MALYVQASSSVVEVVHRSPPGRHCSICQSRRTQPSASLAEGLRRSSAEMLLDQREVTHDSCVLFVFLVEAESGGPNGYGARWQRNQLVRSGEAGAFLARDDTRSSITILVVRDVLVSTCTSLHMRCKPFWMKYVTAFQTFGF